MADPFEEVEERINDERYRSLTRKYLPWAIGCFAILVLFIGGREFVNYQQEKSIETSDLSFQEAIKVLETGNDEDASQKLAALAESDQDGYPVLALITLAQKATDDGNHESARDYYDQASLHTQSVPIAQISRLRAFYAAAEAGATIDELSTRLSELELNGGNFALLAKELLAVKYVEALNYEEALLLLHDIRAQGLSLTSLHQRTQLLREYAEKRIAPKSGNSTSNQAGSDQTELSDENSNEPVEGTTDNTDTQTSTKTPQSEDAETAADVKDESENPNDIPNQN